MGISMSEANIKGFRVWGIFMSEANKKEAKYIKGYG